jgi:hypothetical protein
MRPTDARARSTFLAMKVLYERYRDEQTEGAA